MASGNEDCASVLEQFIHDAANLPAEVNYMMEEIQAKDKEMQKHLSAISSKDSNLQKHIKANGAIEPHPKEQEYAEFTKKHYDICAQLQRQKIALSEKACMILDRHLRKLDVKISGLDDYDTHFRELPSTLKLKAEQQKSFIDVPPPNLPLQQLPTSAINASAYRANAQIAASIRPPQPRQLSQIITSIPLQRSSAPTTPASALQQHKQQEREHSAGADSKRRKLNMSASGINLPAQPSSLRQSSIGPGTPKAGTPTGGSRSGSIPRTLGSQQGTTKKSGTTKKVPHNQVTKLKNKHTKQSRLTQPGRKKGQSPSVRGNRGGTAASEEDSVLSSAEASDTDASQSRSRRNKKGQVEEKDVEMEEEEEDVDEDAEDDRRYCICNQRSYGEMVACENDDCPYQWFHTGCLNMKKIPDEDEDWYCPTCRVKPEIQAKMQKKQQKKK